MSGQADGHNEYGALTDRADGFFAATVIADAESFACRRGCAQCCHVELSLSPVETAAVRGHFATHDGAQARIQSRAAARDGRDTRCVMLDNDGACDIYDARPLVCRTQGLALRYPAGIIPVAAIRAREAVRTPPAESLPRGTAPLEVPTPPGEITWCPLNYVGRAPAAGHVLDADRLDQAHAVVNRRFAKGALIPPLTRTKLRQIAAEPPLPR